MNKRVVFHLTAIVTLVIGLAMGACTALSFYWGDPAVTQRGLLLAALATVLPAAVTLWLTRGDLNLSRRDGFAIVTLGWLVAALFGALPYVFAGVIPHPVAALFETMSGFTTTGASVLPAGAYPTLESVPRGILFWRALTHWFGGMGVLVLCVAILPFLGVGGMQLYRAEMPGPSKDRLTPRITTTAKLLWSVYAGLTAAQTLLLRFLGGMSWFDAVCHSFATLATGGFSTRTDSIGAYNSVVIETIVMVFMFAAGVNFALHYYTLTGRPGRCLRDPEFRGYTLILLALTLAITLVLWPALGAGGIRPALFQTLSMMTTTGFVSADFNAWPHTARLLLVVLMLIGGCAGSTGGGIKVVRIMMMLKAAWKELNQFMRPQAILPVKYKGRMVDADIIGHILAFLLLYGLIFLTAALVMTRFTPDLETATSAVIATLSNIGPGLAAVGATQNYAAIPPPGQLVLTLCMLLGRLELYTVLILLLPGFWRR